MAVATYTSTTYKNGQPKFHHIGDMSIGGVAKWTAAGTVGDILFLAKVPHGARVVDFYEYHTNGQTAAAMDFGFNKGVAAGGGANISCLVQEGAVATMNRLSLANSPNTGKGPVQISVSDTDPVKYTALVGRATSGTFTITVVVSWALTYRFDGPDPV